MKKLAFLLLFSAAIQVKAQTKNNNIIIGKKDSVYSHILNEKREIWIYLPSSYNPENSSKRFPVMYLLDGDAHFHSVTGLIQQLAGGINGNSIFPDMIVVGIPNTDRTRDLTHVASRVTPDGREADFLKSSGGGENFISFMRKELIPSIEKKYYTAPHRMLVGHSFGGIVAINVLLNHTDLFNSYISIDPSMWWAEGDLIQQARKKLASKDFKNKSLYLAVANTMPPGIEIKEVENDTSLNTEHIRSIMELTHILEANKNNGLEYAWKFYSEDDHGSVPLISEYDGLRFIFNDYRLSANAAIMGLDTIIKHYKKVSLKMGYTILPPEELVNGLGYFHLQNGDIEKAIQHFKWNVINYSQSSNVYDSLGDALIASGDKEKAIENYKIAIKLDPQSITRSKLDELMKK